MAAMGAGALEANADLQIDAGPQRGGGWASRASAQSGVECFYRVCSSGVTGFSGVLVRRNPADFWEDQQRLSDLN